MKNVSLLLVAGLFLASCGAPTGSSSTGPRFSGAANDTSGNLVSANVRFTSNGSPLMVMSRTGGVSCTAAFDEPASAGGSELAQLNCTDSNNGTATLVYDDNAEPVRVVYSAGSSGGGTINLS